MKSFNYEWWHVDIQLPTGRYTAQYKGKNKDSVIRQIKKEVEKSNSLENLSKPWFEQIAPIKEVYWDTLHLDRVGYQRLS